MSRYYYDCPIKAAFMIKYFGVSIYTHDFDNGVHPKRWRDYDESVDSLAGDIKSGCQDRYYIHPDSLHLLEPQLGDLVATPIAGEHGAVICDVMVLRAFKLSEFKERLIIIQRNGIPFMHPEVEND